MNIPEPFDRLYVIIPALNYCTFNPKQQSNIQKEVGMSAGREEPADGLCFSDR